MSDDSGWEARMAERSRERERRKVARVVSAVVDAPQPAWLNGWYREAGSSTVLVGVGVHCVACGRDRGITSVVFPDDWDGGPPMPVWPFHPDDCPLCLALGYVS